MLRNLLDKIEPLFHKGGKLEKLYPLYEANDTFLYKLQCMRVEPIGI